MIDDEKTQVSCGLVAFIFIVLICLTGTVVKCCGGVPWTYSSGHRDGVVQKFSQKGMIWKSWGELGLPGFKLRGKREQSGNVWYFSVTGLAVIKALNELKPGQTARLHYRQVFVRPIQLDSDFVIERVEIIKNTNTEHEE